MKLIYKIILGALLSAFVVLYWLSTITEGEYYRSHSPDGQYSIYASRDKYFNLNIPFSKFSDAGGKIHLYDELNNELVSSSSISMISNIDNLSWTEKELYSKGQMSNIKLPRKIHPKIIKEHQKLIVKNDALSFFIQGKHYIVSKSSHRNLIVKNENGDSLLQNIKYFSRINNGFQVLNKNNTIEFYDADLNKRTEAPDTKMNILSVCGNVTTYGLKIEETGNYYRLKKAVGFTDFNFQNYQSIDSVNTAKVKDIYFLNKKRELKFDGNNLKKELVIIDFEKYSGILSEQYGIEYFDSIDTSNGFIKVTRNNLHGYYGITTTTYISLEPFEFNLAKFKNTGPSGENRQGYVDKQGNEYYD